MLWLNEIQAHIGDHICVEFITLLLDIIGYYWIPILLHIVGHYGAFIRAMHALRWIRQLYWTHNCVEYYILLAIEWRSRVAVRTHSTPLCNHRETQRGGRTTSPQKVNKTIRFDTTPKSTPEIHDANCVKVQHSLVAAATPSQLFFWCRDQDLMSTTVWNWIFKGQDKGL